MMRNLIAVLFLLLCSQGCYVFSGGGDPAPPVPVVPVNPVGPVIDEWGFNVSIPAAMQGRREQALKLSAVVDEFANQIEHDGEQPEPRMVSSTDIAILFDRIVEYGFKGEGAYTQAVSDIVSKQLDALETNNEAFDLADKDRRNVAQLFRALAQAFREVK